MTSEKRIKVATISGVHGIKGEVKLHSFVENDNFFSKNPILSDFYNKKHFTLKITGTIKNGLIAKIDGINDRNNAELLKNTELFALESALPPLADDEFYHSQLIGLEARSENGGKIGTIAAVHNYGAGDILEITTVSSGSEMLPLSDPWVGKINIEQGFITLTLAEYL